MKIGNNAALKKMKLIYFTNFIKTMNTFNSNSIEWADKIKRFNKNCFERWATIHTESTFNQTVEDLLKQREKFVLDLWKMEKSIMMFSRNKVDFWNFKRT